MTLIQQQQTDLVTLSQLKQWANAFISLQLSWVDCGSRLNSTAALRIWERFDTMICSAMNQADRASQLATIRLELPKLTGAMIGCLKKSGAKRLHDPRIQRIPMQPRNSPSNRIRLTHQWIPPVFKRIQASVERHTAVNRCRPALADAVERIVQVIHDENPYAFFSVLYQPPPASLERPPCLLVSPFVRDIVRLLDDDFHAIEKLGAWMHAPEDAFWKNFVQFTLLVRRFAVAFHVVMLHLYAIAMEREDPHITAAAISIEIQDAIKEQTSKKLSSRFNLAKWMRQADDPVVRESYCQFPEVLVFVNEWRREFSDYEYGFEPTERAYDYDLGVNRWRSAKTWRDMEHHTKEIVQLWRQTALRSDAVQPIELEELGYLEEGIKTRLVEITDIFYKQNLAKWMAFRNNHAQARALCELKFLKYDEGMESGSLLRRVTKHTIKRHEAKEPKRFRSPQFRSPGSFDCPVNVEPPSTSRIDDDDVLQWTDEEVDAHEQPTERIHELQRSMLNNRERLKLPLVIHDPTLSCDPSHAIDHESTAAGLLAGCRRLREITLSAVKDGEEIALHSAAEALIQRPSLREAPAQDHQLSLVELDDSIQNGVKNLSDLLAAVPKSSSEDELLITRAQHLVRLLHTPVAACHE